MFLGMLVEVVFDGELVRVGVAWDVKDSLFDKRRSSE
jgi:hypothetical protein